MTNQTTTSEVEFWFEFGSVYSYVSLMRIEDEARQRNLTIVWKPFLLGPVFQAVGFKVNPFVEQKEKRAYILKDIARQCRKYGLKWLEPNPFPRTGVLPLRIAMIGADKPWMGAYCRGVMELNYTLDKDINLPENLAPLLTELGLPAADLLEQAKSDPVKALLRQQTEQAHAKGIFGAPTFMVGTEMFWGNDRMEEALQFAADQGK